MITTRRTFVKAALATGSLSLGSAIQTLAADIDTIIEGNQITLTPSPEEHVFLPLENISIETPEGVLLILDGKGREYFKTSINQRTTFTVGGSLGNHVVVLKDKKGKIKDLASFKVDAKTEINDKDKVYQDLLNILYWTMTSGAVGEAATLRYKDKFHEVFVRWLRDHVHVLKGMKYFHHELKSGIDLYAESQREDGMIWDNIYKRDKEKNWWDKRFSYDNFIMPVENGTYEFHRIPVEADVEYLFLEGLYYTWKATGDHSWMKSRLDHAMKVVKYSTTDAYRWSKKYQLIKRGFTIDTWDFQAYEDTLVVGGDIMVVDKDKTKFGIMYGDNTGMAISCSYLSDMLEFVGRNNEAAQIDKLGKDIQQRVNDLSWNGNFYTHHVPEDPTVKRDLGVDQSKQVSLSNAYSLNRGVTHDQAVSIIKTYQKLKTEMPASSPGEWYAIYPPFEKGFGKNDTGYLWEYMNGGVTPIVAGELARGAFEHGFEEYGVDILNRVRALAKETDDYLHCAYRGKMPDKPARNFTPLSIKDVATINYPGKGAKYNGEWIGETTDNAAITTKIFHDIPFQLLNPDSHSKTCIALRDAEKSTASVTLPIQGNPKSVYLLHTMQPSKFAGSVNFKYSDGTMYTDYITDDKIGHWWRLNNERPSSLEPACKKAWRSNNDAYVAFYVYGIDNPHQQKTLQQIELVGARQSREWMVLGVTLSDYPVFFMPDKISFGIPDNWGAAAVVYALVEGLVGVKDTGVALNKATLSPRWEAAGVQEVSATVKYEASGGFLSYHYKTSDDKRFVDLIFTGDSDETQLNLLLPKGKTKASVTRNGAAISSTIKKVENSVYATLTVLGIGVHTLRVEFA